MHTEREAGPLLACADPGLLKKELRFDVALIPFVAPPKQTGCGRKLTDDARDNLCSAFDGRAELLTALIAIGKN